MKLLKKINKILIISIVIFSLGLGSVFAYSTDSYSIYVPSTYERQSSSNTDNPIIFNDKNLKSQNFNVYVEANSENNNFKNATDADITKIADGIVSEIYSDYKINVDVLKKEKTTLNGYDGIFISTKWNTQATAGYDLYQNQYEFTSKNHIYVITFTTSNQDYLNSSEVDSIKKSFSIKDKLFENDKLDASKIAIYAVLIVVVAGVVVFTARKALKK